METVGASFPEALGAGEAVALLRRAAGARGVAWPQAPGAVTGVGGFRLELTGRPGPERLVWGTLPGQQGLMAVFSDDRLLAFLSGDLGAITAVQPVKLPGLPGYALMVDDRYENLLGAFEREERRRIYTWDGRGLRQAYRGITRLEEFRHARWENPRAPNRWQLRRTLGDIGLRDGTLTEAVRLQQLEAPGSPRAAIPPEGAFRVTGEERHTRTLRWNARLRRFEAA